MQQTVHGMPMSYAMHQIEMQGTIAVLKTSIIEHNRLLSNTRIRSERGNCILPGTYTSGSMGLKTPLVLILSASNSCENRSEFLVPVMIEMLVQKYMDDNK